MSDAINSPNHYNSGDIETIDYIQDKLTAEQFEGYLVGNVMKYVSRYRHKNGMEDLKKARWHLDRLIDGVPDGDGVVNICLYCGEHYWSTRSTKVCAACRSKVGNP